MRRALVLLALAFPATAQAEPLQKLDGTLSGPARGAPEEIAMRYVRANVGELGLDRADLEALRGPVVTEGGEITTVRWRQAVDGIPAADSELRVNLAADGRVLNVLGDPVHDLDADTTPRLDAGEAVRAVQAATGSYRALPRAGGPKGATRATDYADGTTAELALDGRRLVWRVTYRAASDAVYDAFVDARSGLVRRRVNLVKSAAPASVWENHPGAPRGGTAAVRDLEAAGWLATGAATLSGPNAHAYSDTDDDDRVGVGEEVTAPFTAALVTFATSGGGCQVTKPCTWNHNLAGSWQTNRRQSTVQAFYFANRFHDHLAADPIGFGPSSGSFDGADRLILETLDGAATGPDPAHRSNATMYTPPDGGSPRMQMYLFQPPAWRTINGADDGSIVYHEYAHGLSSRLVTDAAGRGALNSPQAGAMGEGWSDWYAKDFIVGQFADLDTAAPAEVDMGSYTDSVAHTLRTQALDCPVGASAAACPASGSAGSGGYTYGDFGRIFDGPEVHADGEIWAQTLWDLRGAVGSLTARRLITGGMRLAPPEPTFLDMRNVILLADQAAGGGSRVAIWDVFARRGMGFYASDAPLLEDFSPPPSPGEPRGRIAGVITDADTGAPVAGASAAVGGLATGPDRLAGVTGADGGFAIEGVPSRSYSGFVVTAPGYDRAAGPITVPVGGTARFDVTLRRNWAALAGGAVTTPGPNAGEYADQGCGPDAAVDQQHATGWSTVAAPGGKSMTVTLPAAVDLTDVALDPGEACGDDAKSAAREIRVEASAGGAWTPVATGVFGAAGRGRLNGLAASYAGARYVRVTLLSNQGGGDFLDLSELVVHGRPVGGGAPPTPPPPATPAPPLRAPSFTLPARGKSTLRFSVRCAAPCRVTARLTVDRPTARRLGLGRKLTAASLTRTVKAGRTTLTLKLTKRAARTLRKRSFRARLKVTAAYAGAKPVSRSRQVTFRR